MKCTRCGRASYRVNDYFDDRDGTQSCAKCGHRVETSAIRAIEQARPSDGDRLAAELASCQERLDVLSEEISSLEAEIEETQKLLKAMQDSHKNMKEEQTDLWGLRSKLILVLNSLKNKPA